MARQAPQPTLAPGTYSPRRRKAEERSREQLSLSAHPRPPDRAHHGSFASPRAAPLSRRSSWLASKHSARRVRANARAAMARVQCRLARLLRRGACTASIDSMNKVRARATTSLHAKAGRALTPRVSALTPRSSLLFSVARFSRTSRERTHRPGSRTQQTPRRSSEQLQVRPRRSRTSTAKAGCAWSTSAASLTLGCALSHRA